MGLFKQAEAVDPLPFFSWDTLAPAPLAKWRQTRYNTIVVIGKNRIISVLYALIC
jgi:hypothetical protein